MSTELPTVVVLPGLDGTGLLSESFSRGDWHGHHVLVVPLPREGPQDYPALAALIATRLPAGRLILIGESFSGPLAMRLAKSQGARVSALVIVGGFCASPAPVGLALMPLRPLFLLKPPSRLVRRFLVGPDASREMVDAVTSAVRSVPSATLTERARVVLTLKEDDCPTFNALPILLIQARQDALLPWDAQSQLERHFPDAESVWIESPHLLLATRTRECRSAVLEFLQRL